MVTFQLFQNLYSSYFVLCSDRELLPEFPAWRTLLLCGRFQPDDLLVLESALRDRLPGGLHRLSDVLLRAVQCHERSLHSNLWRLHLYGNLIFVKWVFVYGFFSLVMNLYHVHTVIPNYCTAAPNSTVFNSEIVGSYDSKLGDISIIGCAIGYSANGSSSNATCISFNNTNGEWSGLNLTCTRMTCCWGFS